MSDIHWCPFCGQRATESHHIIHRSQAKYLINSKINQIYLCHGCHDKLHHGKDGRKLDLILKQMYKEKLIIALNSNYITKEQIKETFEIGNNATESFCKVLVPNREGKYTLEDVLRRGMGGKIY